ncbi:MAG: hypothetical protein ABIH41_01340, partial [Nanoarchaeota archaeon]
MTAINEALFAEALYTFSLFRRWTREPKNYKAHLRASSKEALERLRQTRRDCSEPDSEAYLRLAVAALPVGTRNSFSLSEKYIRKMITQSRQENMDDRLGFLFMAEKFYSIMDQKTPNVLAKIQDKLKRSGSGRMAQARQTPRGIDVWKYEGFPYIFDAGANSQMKLRAMRIIDHVTQEYLASHPDEAGISLFAKPIGTVVSLGRGTVYAVQERHGSSDLETVLSRLDANEATRR